MTKQGMLMDVQAVQEGRKRWQPRRRVCLLTRQLSADGSGVQGSSDKVVPDIRELEMLARGDSSLASVCTHALPSAQSLVPVSSTLSLIQWLVGAFPLLPFSISVICSSSSLDHCS